ncbi:zeta toxin family protein (plasmid) [Nocardia sp. CA-084685]|uniref:zeta toxin family protein n=1 Tax=Nocardia sp. CA-084685 TaxID=3239970 RepID=UPI003D9519BB
MTSPRQIRARYVLSHARAEQVFTAQIARAKLGGVDPARGTPVAQLIVGQHGAGQLAAAALIADEFDERPVIIDTAELRHYHPEYLSLSERYGHAEAQARVFVDEQRWLSMLITAAAQQRVNMIIVAEIATKAELDNIVAPLIDPIVEPGAPYRIEAVAMGVHTCESWLGWWGTHLLDCKYLGPHGTMRPQWAMHNLSEEHLLTVADWLDANPHIAMIGVHRRQAVPIEPSSLLRNPASLQQFDHLPHAVASKVRLPSGEWDDFLYADTLDNASTRLDPRLSTRDVLSLTRVLRMNDVDSAAVLRLYLDMAEQRPEWVPALILARDAAHEVLSPAVVLPDLTDLLGADAVDQYERVVVVDRFPVVTAADIAGFAQLGIEFTDVEIAVIDPAIGVEATVRPSDDQLDFFRDEQIAGSPERNPISSSERTQALQAALKAAGLNDRKFTVTTIARPEIDPGFADRCRGRVVACITDPANTRDLVRNHHYETALGRRIYTVTPPFPRPPIEEIAAAYHSGDPRWIDALAEGAAEVFLAANGPERLLDLFSSAASSDLDDLAAAALSGHPLAPPGAWPAPIAEVDVSVPGAEVDDIGPAANP